MPRVDLVRSSPVLRTPRVMQMEGLFDVPPSARSEERWSVDLDLPEEWHIGVLVGPSGSGKSTIARECFGAHLAGDWDWPTEKSLLDGFPASMGIKEIVDLLSSVGFSSPPSWVRPFHVLSTGEQFRVTLARTLAEGADLSVIDEYTSVVDRTVARIGSAALQKTVRRRGQRVVLATCHYDVLDWLEPDWVYEPHTGEFRSGRCLQRPPIPLTIQRVHSSAWALFRRHHYLDTALNSAAMCWVAFWGDVPVAFTAILHFPHAVAKTIKREHRTVCLPDFQGIGIGNALSRTIAALCKAQGYRFQSQTSHPAMIRSRDQSLDWKMIAAPNVKSASLPKRAGPSTDWTGKRKTIATRLRATFEYVGPSMDRETACDLWTGSAAPLT